VGICASTVFVRQHSFADVISGILIPIPTCLLTYFVVVPKLIDPKKKAVEPAEAASETIDEVPENAETETPVIADTETPVLVESEVPADVNAASSAEEIVSKQKGEE